MAGKKGHSGGPRPNSGRKKSEITLAREKFLAEQEQHAQDAFAYHVEVMNDTACKPELRLIASKEVMDRVWGKTKSNDKLDVSATVKKSVTIYLPSNGRTETPV